MAKSNKTSAIAPVQNSGDANTSGPDNTPQTDQTLDTNGGDQSQELSPEASEFNALVSEYMELFGQLPAPDTTLDDLKKAIAAHTPEVTVIPAKDGSDNLHSELPPNTNDLIEDKEADQDNPVFAAHPKLTEYFETSDGNRFFTDAAAKNHAKSLEDRTVNRITKG